MSTPAQTEGQTRSPLSRERVLEAAVSLADRDGIEALTMRRLADELGVEAMSLYYHVANKEAILDGVVEVIVGEINEVVDDLETPDPSYDWKEALRSRILAAREVLLRHRWAPEVIEKRSTMSPAITEYFDGVAGIFRKGGFTWDTVHHAMHALGSRALGFTQELFQPESSEDEEVSEAMLVEMMGKLPNLMGMLSEIAHDDPDSTLGWCDDQAEFEFGLDLLLNGLDRLRQPT